jgi:hypothetical protein
VDDDDGKKRVGDLAEAFGWEQSNVEEDEGDFGDGDSCCIQDASDVEDLQRSAGT